MAEPAMAELTVEDDAEKVLLDDLPYECLVECLTHIDTAEELCAVSLANTALRDAAYADVLWRNLCVKHQHGQSLDFRQALGSFGHPDAKPVEESAAAASGAPAEWRDVYRKSRDSLRTTICIDTGRGYAKYGLSSQQRPEQIQICQPGAEATQESLFPLAFRRLGLRRADISEYAAIVSEPFRLAHADVERERQHWRHETERRILQGFQLKQVCIVDSASLCLFAHTLTSGVVVNIGFGMTFVVPVLRGHVIREAVRVMRFGGASLSNFFAEILQVRGHDISWTPALGGERIADITVARNLKERGCEAYPTSLFALTGKSSIVDVLRELFKQPDPEISRVTMGQVTFDLGWERYLPAELFFEPNDTNLHGLVMESIDATVELEASGRIDASLAEGVKTDENASNAAGGPSTQTFSAESSSSAGGSGGGGAPGVRRQPSRPVGSLREALLGRVVLSGGSSQISGLPQRLAHELGNAVEAARGGGGSAGAAEASPGGRGGGGGGATRASVRVRPSIDGDATTWIGASVLAGTSTFAEHWCVHAPTGPLPNAQYWVDDENDDDDDYEEEEDSDDDDDEEEDEEGEDEEEEEGDDEEEEAPAAAEPENVS